MKNKFTKRRVALALVALGLGFQATAQTAPTPQWDARFGGSDLDYLTSLQQTTDGGYILGGPSASGQSGDKSQALYGIADYWVVKTSAAGQKEWDARFGGDSYEMLTCLQQTTDGGYILGGYSSSGISFDKTQNNRGVGDYWVIKISSTGAKEWDARFGGNQADQLTAIKQTADGGYILGGRSFSDMAGDKSQPSRGNSDYWVVKITGAGVKQWDARFGGLNNDVLTALQPTIDGGYLLGGYSASGITGDKTSASYGDTDFWIVKISSTGAKQWDASFGGANTEELIALELTADGGYMLGGHSSSGISGSKTQASQGSFDYWVVKVSQTGAQQWDARFGGSGTDQLTSLKQTSNGQFVLGGRSNSGVSGNKSQASQGGFDYWVVKMNDTAAQQWDARFGGTGTDELYALQETTDGSYILGGRSDSGISGDKSQASQGNFDYWLVKLTNNAVLTGTVSPTSYSHGATVNVPYTATGNYNAGNTFTAQLSDATGSFTSGVTTIGQVTAANSGIIAATLPAGIPSGTGYRIRVVASSPLAENTPDNGTDITIGSLNGPYVVNPNGTGDYTTLSDVAYELNTFGISGPVTVEVDGAATFTDAVELRTIPGSSTTNKVTINGNGATIDYCGTTTNRDLIRLDGTDNIDINGFVLNATCSYGWGVHLIGDVSNVTLADNTINLSATHSTINGRMQGVVATNSDENPQAAGGRIDGLTISGNTITNGYYGIRIQTASDSVLATSVTVSNNTLTNTVASGIDLRNLDNPTVSGNQIEMRTGAGYLSANSIGLLVINTENGLNVTGNRITSAGAIGMYLQNVNRNSNARGLVANNMVGGNFQNTAVVHAMQLNNASYLDVYHNSTLADNGAAGSGMLISNQFSRFLNMQNNSFAYTGAGAGYALQANNGNSNFLTLDHNNYYTTGAKFVRFAGADRATLADLKSAPGPQNHNLQSLNADPLYVSNTDLHLQAMSPLINQGAALASVGADYDGDARTGAADIGGDEFMAIVRVAVSDLVSEVYPNPFHQQLTIRLPEAQAGAVQVALTDLMGRRIISQQYGVEAGATSLSVPVGQNIAQGVYLLQVTQGDAMSTFRVVKQ